MAQAMKLYWLCGSGLSHILCILLALILATLTIIWDEVNSCVTFYPSLLIVIAWFFGGVCGIVKPMYNYGNCVHGLKICTIWYSWLCNEQKVSLLVKPTVALFRAFGPVPFSSDIVFYYGNLSSRMLRSDISLIIQLSWCNSNIACIIQKKFTEIWMYYIYVSICAIKFLKR